MVDPLIMAIDKMIEAMEKDIEAPPKWCPVIDNESYSAKQNISNFTEYLPFNGMYNINDKKSIQVHFEAEAYVGSAWVDIQIKIHENFHSFANTKKIEFSMMKVYDNQLRCVIKYPDIKLTPELQKEVESKAEILTSLFDRWVQETIQPLITKDNK